MPLANIDHAIRLRQEPLFSGLPNSGISRLLARLQPIEFEVGANLYVRGGNADFLYLIEEGSLHITTPGGRIVSLNGLRCGEEAASDMPTYLCSATATTSVKALRLPRAVLGELAIAAPSLRIQALLGLSEELSGEKLRSPVTEHESVDQPLPFQEMAGWLSVICMPPAVYFLADAGGLIVEASLLLAILAAAVRDFRRPYRGPGSGACRACRVFLADDDLAGRGLCAGYRDFQFGAELSLQFVDVDTPVGYAILAPDRTADFGLHALPYHAVAECTPVANLTVLPGHRRWSESAPARCRRHRLDGVQLFRGHDVFGNAFNQQIRKHHRADDAARAVANAVSGHILAGLGGRRRGIA